MRHVMRSIRQSLGVRIANPFTEHDAVGESRCTRGDVDGGSSGEVKTTELVGPACRVPGPACNGVVDYGGPDEHEDNAGEHAAAVSCCADCEGWSVSYSVKVE